MITKHHLTDSSRSSLTAFCFRENIEACGQTLEAVLESARQAADRLVNQPDIDIINSHGARDYGQEPEAPMCRLIRAVSSEAKAKLRAVEEYFEEPAKA